MKVYVVEEISGDDVLLDRIFATEELLECRIYHLFIVRSNCCRIKFVKLFLCFHYVLAFRMFG